MASGISISGLAPSVDSGDTACAALTSQAVDTRGLSIGGETMKHTKQDQADARERLLGWVKSGDTVYTILRHRAASGMSRRISLVLPPTEKGGRFAHLDSNVAILLGLKGDNGEGVTLSGCGMDMGFHLVYSLAGELFGDGYALKQEWI